MSDHRPVVLVMAKTPRLGHGKTRLARGIGRTQAWRINRALQAHTLRTIRDPRWRVVLAIAPDGDVHRRVPGVWPDDGARIAQGRGDLGARLARAFVAMGRRPIAVIGVDCPEVRRSDVAAALRAGRRHGAALGPSVDGGFWVFAARHAAAAAHAFADVRWSTAHALADMLRALPHAAILRTLQDIDDVEDWCAYRQRAATRKSRSILR